MLSRAANFEYLHVPFQGTAPSIQSLLSGQIASCISPIGSFVPHVRAGTLRALATTGAQRSLLLPDVPTVAEAGYPALEFAEWFGIFVPARTPNGTVETLSSVLRAALQTKETSTDVRYMAAFWVTRISASDCRTIAIYEYTPWCGLWI